MTDELAAAALAQQLPTDIHAIESARNQVLGDPDFHRGFENRFFETVPVEPENADDQLRLGIGRYILGQEHRASEQVRDLTGSAPAFIRGKSGYHRGLWQVAVKEMDTVLKDHPESRDIHVLLAECYLQLGDEENLANELEFVRTHLGDTADLPYVIGLQEEAAGNYQEAMLQFQQALNIDAEHDGALFRLAYCESIRGETETAIELYERLCAKRPASVGALINLGVLFEDEEDYQLAANCFQKVLDFDPGHGRARMYFEDACASTEMFYDEEKERKEDKRAQVLRIPVTDFELSVRSRNCLANMNVRTLGDLIRLSEQELLSFKNFGETSLMEIKNILNQKGLRLGMMPREDRPTQVIELPVSGDISVHRPVTDLDLSVRSRKALEGLGVVSIGDLIKLSEPRLLACKNFGQTSLAEIKKKLGDLGLSFA